MISSTRGTVEAGDGAVDIVVEPPARTLAEAMPGDIADDGMREILFETGVSLGPVDVDVRVSNAQPLGDEHAGYEDFLGEFDIHMPQGRVFLNGPMTDVLLHLGELEHPKEFVFRIFGSGRESMRDLVVSEAVERYLILVWDASAPGRETLGR